MRIVVAAHSATRVGGVETYLADLIPALSARGHDVGCWFETALEHAEPVVPPAHIGPIWVGSSSVPGDFVALREWRPDVIFVQGLRSVAVEHELLRVAPVVFFAHSYYGACISGEKTTRVPVVRPCQRVFGPACLMHYFPRRCGGLSPVTMLKQYGAQRSKQRLLDEYAAVLVASRHMAREYAAQGVATRVVRLPITTVDVPPGGRRGDCWTLLYLGRLERSKGVSVALQSSARASAALDLPVRLIVAGRGTLAAALRSEAAALTSRHPRLSVEFPGWLSSAARASALGAADLLLMPSLWPEPFGLSGLEAASAGVPTVAFRVGGIADWLEDGITGRAVTLEEDRISNFAAALTETLANRERLEVMRAQAMAKARTLTMAAHVEALESILSDVVEGRHARPA